MANMPSHKLPNVKTITTRISRTVMMPDAMSATERFFFMSSSNMASWPGAASPLKAGMLAFYFAFGWGAINHRRQAEGRQELIGWSSQPGKTLYRYPAPHTTPAPGRKCNSSSCCLCGCSWVLLCVCCVRVLFSVFDAAAVCCRLFSACFVPVYV